jgi:hypothetical protein
MDPDPDPDSAIFIIDLQDAKKFFFSQLEVGIEIFRTTFA